MISHIYDEPLLYEIASCMLEADDIKVNFWSYNDQDNISLLWNNLP